MSPAQLQLQRGDVRLVATQEKLISKIGSIIYFAIYL